MANTSQSLIMDHQTPPPANQMDPDAAGAAELRNVVSAKFGVELPATVAFDYPTVSAMAAFLLAPRLSTPAVITYPAAVAVLASDTTLAPGLRMPADDGAAHSTVLIGLSSAMAASGTGPDGGCCFKYQSWFQQKSLAALRGS